MKLAQPSRWLHLRPRTVTPLAQPTGHFPTLVQTFRVVHILKIYSLCRVPASQRTLPVHSGVGLQARIACKQAFRVTSSRSTARDPLHLPTSEAHTSEAQVKKFDFRSLLLCPFRFFIGSLLCCFAAPTRLNALELGTAASPQALAVRPVCETRNVYATFLTNSSPK